MPSPSRDDLRAHLVATRIAGSVATQVENVLRKAHAVAAGEKAHSFGLTGLDRYTPADVLAEVRTQFGWAHTPGEPGDGPTFIDPDLLLAELDRAAARLALAARRRQRVILATGHPTGVLVLHQEIARALTAGSAQVLTPGDGHGFDLDGAPREIRYLLDVATLSCGTHLYHTHDPRPMEQLLTVLDAAGEAVDLVVGDHGWAGAAAQRGLDVIGIADINDPALPLARAEGRAEVVLGMDDNVSPHHYGPVAAYLTAGIGAA